MYLLIFNISNNCKIKKVSNVVVTSSIYIYFVNVCILLKITKVSKYLVTTNNLQDMYLLIFNIHNNCKTKRVSSVVVTIPCYSMQLYTFLLFFIYC